MRRTDHVYYCLAQEDNQIEVNRNNKQVQIRARDERPVMVRPVGKSRVVATGSG